MNIYVGNLPFSTTEDELRQLFAAHGRVDKVAIVQDKEGTRSRGFGFVEMPDEEAAAAVSALDGHTIEGRDLKVHEARAREARTGGFGSTGGGGGGYGSGGYGSSGGGYGSGGGGGGGGRGRGRR